MLNSSKSHLRTFISGDFHSRQAWRQYRCVGFSNTGVPRLDLNHCTGEGEHWILLQAQVVQITEMLAMANGDKRKFEATFPTSACHLHDHNHRDEDQDRDDSPPQEGKRIKTL